MAKRVNEFAEQGWKLTSAVAYPVSEYMNENTLYFERRKNDG
ncbi:hypothetical protein FACS1894211_15450 [Clostridia bacterium]|nr:hypothetical protein FACS1894211_15450 [Clostridia bacterium]